jgi:uncharacterized LabA/DUF88 family protein
MKRVIFYFDGFNFYNGLRDKSLKEPQWKNYYWIDLFKFCNQFIYEGSELIAVKYFTSPPMNDKKRSKQSAFFGANKLINKEKFLVYNGRFSNNKEIDCRAACKQRFYVLEEKRTDVSIAVNILLDCFENKVDTIILVTADSDQVPTIQAIKEKFPDKKLKVYFPPDRTSADILQHAKPVIHLENNEDKFKIAIMPSIIEFDGKKYTKPSDWKN